MAGKRAQEQARIRILVKRLLKEDEQKFPKVGFLPDVTARQGVYVIRSPGKAVRHVGSTYRAKLGLRQRLEDHLRNRSTFSLAPRRVAGLGANGVLLRSGFTYQFLAINNARVRHLVEHLAIGQLCPKYVGTHIKQSRSR